MEHTESRKFYKYSNLNNPSILLESYDVSLLWDYKNITGSVVKLSQILAHSGKDIEMSDKVNLGSKEMQPQWFDSECEIMKNTKCLLLNRFRNFRDETHLNKYLEVKSAFNKMCKEKELSYRKELQSNLCDSVRLENGE